MTFYATIDWEKVHSINEKVNQIKSSKAINKDELVKVNELVLLESYEIVSCGR